MERPRLTLDLLNPRRILSEFDVDRVTGLAEKFEQPESPEDWEVGEEVL